MTAELGSGIHARPVQANRAPVEHPSPGITKTGQVAKSAPTSGQVAKNGGAFRPSGPTPATTFPGARRALNRPERVPWLPGSLFPPAVGPAPDLATAQVFAIHRVCGRGVTDTILLVPEREVAPCG